MIMTQAFDLIFLAAGSFVLLLALCLCLLLVSINTSR
jgi:hypothetical protein